MKRVLVEDRINLGELPADHPLRNAPLIEIGAGSAQPGKSVSLVKSNWRIARKCFNDLGPAWTKGYVWSAQA